MLVRRSDFGCCFCSVISLYKGEITTISSHWDEDLLTFFSSFQAVNNQMETFWSLIDSKIGFTRDSVTICCFLTVYSRQKTGFKRDPISVIPLNSLPFSISLVLLMIFVLVQGRRLLTFRDLILIHYSAYFRRLRAPVNLEIDWNDYYKN